MFLSDVSIKQPVFATMMMAALVVLGVVSYGRLAIDEYPDITYPIVIAQTSYPGASPEVMERDISRPIEEALNTVQGLKEIGSTSINGVSIVRLVFNLDVDVLAAQQDVQAKIARIRRERRGSCTPCGVRAIRCGARRAFALRTMVRCGSGRSRDRRTSRAWQRNGATRGVGRHRRFGGWILLR